MRIHIVRSGDTLWKLAKRYNVPLQRLIDANPEIQDPNRLEVGMKIRIPTGGVPVRPPKPGHPPHWESSEDKYPHKPEKEWDSSYGKWSKAPKPPWRPYPPHYGGVCGGYPLPPYMPGMGYAMPGIPYMPGVPMMPYPLCGMHYPMSGTGGYGYGSPGYTDPRHAHPFVSMSPPHVLDEESSSSST